MKKYLMWSFERGSRPYDAICFVILAFIFLTPSWVFNDRPEFMKIDKNEPVRRSVDDNGNTVYTVQINMPAFTPASEAEKAAKEKKVKAANGGDDYRLRIEHAQVVTPLEIVKFRDLKVIASMQPCHVLTDMKWAEARLGEKRAAHSYAWNEFLKRGVTLAFGTDYPVEPLTPFRGLYAASTRKSEDGKQEYFPDQKITMDQAIAAYTTGSAFAEFDEKQKGQIVPGMFADFAVLDRDITAASPQQLLQTKVLRTVVGGKTVYEAK